VNTSIGEGAKGWERLQSSPHSPPPLAPPMPHINTRTGSLPPDIYVVVYEDRCDLLQVVIKGPQDSPYADGLFFFDIQLPSEYPDIPPRVYYHSHGDRLNPYVETDIERACVCLFACKLCVCCHLHGDRFNLHVSLLSIRVCLYIHHASLAMSQCVCSVCVCVCVCARAFTRACECVDGVCIRAKTNGV